MRYLSHTEESIKNMLDAIGKESLDELFGSVPRELRLIHKLNLPEAMTEWELTEYFEELGGKGFKGRNFLGAGSYNHYIPSVVTYLTSRSEFLTSYTPYQPEISQGTLQALFEFQTYISQYLGMDYSNASMYDGATSFVEGVLLSIRVTKKNRVVVSSAINPNYREVLKTYADAAGFEIILLDYTRDGKTDLSQLPELEDVASISIQSPNFFGVIEDLEKVKPLIADNKTLFISLFSEIMAFGCYQPPGFYGADLACGEAQSFGINQSFGGPSLGVFAFNKKYLRSVPGRIVGQTTDKDNKRCFCLTLSTREQHIRREKATSNICSNQGINTISTLIYMSLLGGRGLKKIARLNYNNCEYLKEKLRLSGAEIIFNSSGFNEFAVKFPNSFSKEMVEKAGYIPGLKLDQYYNDLKGSYLLTVTEVFNKESLDNFVSLIGGIDEL